MRSSRLRKTKREKKGRRQKQQLHTDVKTELVIFSVRTTELQTTYGFLLLRFGGSRHREREREKKSEKIREGDLKKLRLQFTLGD